MPIEFPSGDWITTEEAAHILGLNVYQVSYAIRTGKIKALKLIEGETTPYVVSLESVKAYKRQRRGTGPLKTA